MKQWLPRSLMLRGSKPRSPRSVTIDDLPDALPSNDTSREEERLQAGMVPTESNEGIVRVISLENTQSHALTCSKSRGSLGHHL